MLWPLDDERERENNNCIFTDHAAGRGDAQQVRAQGGMGLRSRAMGRICQGKSFFSNKQTFREIRRALMIELRAQCILYIIAVVN